MAAFTRLVDSPVPVPRPVQEEMERESRALEEEGDARPWWSNLVCFNRDHFEKTALYSSSEEEVAYFFLLAKQSKGPGAVFLEIQRTTLETGPPQRLDDFFDDGAFDPLLKSFAYDMYEYIDEVDLTFPDGDVIYVLPNLKFNDRYLQTRADPICFEDFVRRFPTRFQHITGHLVQAVCGQTRM